MQREKSLQGENPVAPPPHINIDTIPSAQPFTILAIDPNAAEGDPESGLLGTDFTFFTAFLRKVFLNLNLSISNYQSLFNWLIYCSGIIL